MDMSRRLIAFCIAVLLCAVILGGCGSDNLGNGQVIIVENRAGRNEKVLTFFAPIDGKSSGAVAYRKFIDEYNSSHKGVHVVFEGIATADGFNEYLEERLDAGRGDDVFIVNEDSVKSLYSKGYFCDLSGLAGVQMLNKAAKDQAEIGDIAYCIPVNMSAYALFVNLDVLKQYALEAPKNLDEFISCCMSIKKQGGTPISISRWHATAIPAIANGFDKIYSSDAPPRLIAGLNSGEQQISAYMLEGFEVFEQFVREGWYGDSLTGAAVDALKAGQRDIPDFAANKTAFYFGPLEYMQWVEDLNPALNYQVQGVPTAEGLVSLVTAESRLCVNANSKNKQEALNFIAYLTQRIYQDSLTNGDALLPVYDSLEYNLKNEHMRPLYETYAEGVRIPIEDAQLKITYWNTVRELCLKIFDGMTAGEAAAEYDRIQLEQIKIYKN